MIADDEYLSRYVIKTLISKKFNKIKIVGEAENGRQAIEYNKKLRPDMIIMDIKMPGINGIDASKEILDEFPDTSVLILTAYDNFDYIKRALDIGVKGYILKPVKEEEVVEKISKVLKDIDEKQNKFGLKEQVEEKIKVVRPFIENELISTFITGNFDVGKVENYINFLQEEIKSGYFMLISPGPGYPKNIHDAVRNKILREKILSIAVRHLPMMKKCFFGNCIGNTIVVFFPVDEGLPLGEVRKEAMVVGQEIKSRIKVMSGIDTMVGIGNTYSGIRNFNRSYNEANYALKKAMETGTVIHFGSLENVGNINVRPEYPLELESRFIERIKLGNMDKARELAEEIIAAIVDNQYSMEAIKECISEFITVLKRAVQRMGVGMNYLSDSGTLADLGSLTQIEEIEVWCKRCIFNLIEQIETKSSKNVDVVNKVFEYVNMNFNRDITLELAASEVDLSPQYLSKVFKEKYGVNFIDYITKKRIEYAEELLKTDSKSIKEISKMVGYEDSNYFCKIFKKDTGLTPKQYRAQKITGELS